MINYSGCRGPKLKWQYKVRQQQNLTAAEPRIFSNLSIKCSNWCGQLINKWKINLRWDFEDAS